jgi:hypothetical protein
MKYLPFENFVLTTSLPVDEVRNRLTNNIEPKKGSFIAASKTKTSKLYEGSILNNTFKIYRIINYRNSFLPVITGEISQDWGKTEIKVKMKPTIFTMIFMAIWLGITGSVCIAVLVAAILTFKDIFRDGFSPVILIPYGMFIFGYLLVTLGFKFESSTSKKFLKTLFEAQYKE